MNRYKVYGKIYIVGGSDLSHPCDCSVYLIAGNEPVLIDSGAGESFNRIVDNIWKLGIDPEMIAAVIATHAHLDHIGALYQFREKFGARIIAHELDADAIETGKGTGAEYYGMAYQPCPVDIRLTEEEESLFYGGYQIRTVHIPGHTPGGIAVYIDAGKRVLFGQDVHGPYFLKGSDTVLAKRSLQKLIELEADILCEGHFGIYEPAGEVRRYIESYLNSLT